jgi:hypothetical protein
MAVRASLTASTKMECIWVDPEEHRGRRPASDLCYIVVEKSSLCAIHRTVEMKMGNGFVVEAALTLGGVCAIDFVQVVVQVESTRSKSGKCCILRR